VSSSPSVLAASAARVDAALQERLGVLLPRLSALHPALGPVSEHLGTFLHGGKRIRPTLLLLGYAAGRGAPAVGRSGDGSGGDATGTAGGADREAVMGPALALELLHTCALLHDDVIDRAATRRGRPTVHHAVAAEHRAAGWAGDALGYGEATAILLGDLAFVQADELFLEAAVAPEDLLAGFRRFTVLREEVMAGQYLDLHAATARLTSRELALTVATLKSGRYSVARPLEIGALLAGAEPALVAGLGAVGDPLGRAFQVRDDLLGVFGEEAVTGKSVASDLAEGKRTLLVAEAAERLDAADRERLEAGLGDPDLGADEAAALRELLEACGARAATERYVEEAVDEALAALDRLDLDAEVAAELTEVARLLGDRAT
jgi:geranylgeranyl diphosphate synthase, type I